MVQGSDVSKEGSTPSLGPEVDDEFQRNKERFSRVEREWNRGRNRMGSSWGPGGLGSLGKLSWGGRARWGVAFRRVTLRDCGIKRE